MEGEMLVKHFSRNSWWGRHYFSYFEKRDKMLPAQTTTCLIRKYVIADYAWEIMTGRLLGTFVRGWMVLIAVLLVSAVIIFSKTLALLISLAILTVAATTIFLVLYGGFSVLKSLIERTIIPDIWEEMSWHRVVGIPLQVLFFLVATLLGDLLAWAISKELFYFVLTIEAIVVIGTISAITIVIFAIVVEDREIVSYSRRTVGSAVGKVGSPVFGSRGIARVIWNDFKDRVCHPVEWID